MLAGPNGAGKSTLYETRIKPTIPPDTAPFINADIIQRDELKDPSMEASYKAAEIAESRRRAHLAEGKSFVSELTFSHESKLALIQEAKDAGFRVVMYHVNVRSADLSVRRVALRTKEGGHNVPENKIRERYVRNQSLIGEYYVDCQPGSSGQALPDGGTIPVKQTASTVPPDLMQNVMRRPSLMTITRSKVRSTSER